MKNEEKSVSYSFWQITKKSKKMETQKNLFEIQPNNSDTAIMKNILKHTSHRNLSKPKQQYSLH